MDPPRPGVGGGRIDLGTATPRDMSAAQATSSDLSTPADLSPSMDLSSTRDLAPSADLAPPADLSPRPACGGPCAGNRICCHDTCIDPTTDGNNCGGCGVTCSGGACGTSIAASMTTQPSDWLFNGSATYDGAAMTAVLTQAINSQAGTVIYKNAIVTDAFDVSFDFRISTHGADGIGFMIQKTGNSAVGMNGSGFGMLGLDGYGVELDTHNNGGCGDADDNHAAIDALAACPSNSEVPTAVAVSSNLSSLYGYDLGDNQWRTCVIHLENGAMTVTINQSSSNMPAISNAALPAFSAGESYYFGFAAATGGKNEKHEIRNLTVTFPKPRCL